MTAASLETWILIVLVRHLPDNRLKPNKNGNASGGHPQQDDQHYMDRAVQRRAKSGGSGATFSRFRRGQERWIEVKSIIVGQFGNVPEGLAGFSGALRAWPGHAADFIQHGMAGVRG